MTAATPRHDASPFGLVAARVAKTTLCRKARALLERGDSPRSGERVWRNSYTEGTIEDRVWKPIHDGSKRGGKRWTKALLKAAKDFENRTRRERREKEPGVRNGALGEVGIAVLEYLYELVDYATGRLEPSIQRIADDIGRSYSAVHKGLCRLRKEGFIHWMRRSRPVDNPEPGGQQVEQIQNAYALLIPQGMKSWLASLLRKAPTPGCEEDRRKSDKEAYEAMLVGLTAEERHVTTWNGDSLLGETLRRLAASLDARDLRRGESSTNGETGGSY
ncbi:LexA family transcriptional regulator [Novosphingobium clariflavum]|uniref:Helix-turn-helix domain-containing protein n=1 Tax=Novosphingobium clariflavum TaxID=2029884 RepID=A0ABV6SFX3_9SPHN|nr:hypothetical protein [Novosphingobium clariflavum]